MFGRSVNGPTAHVRGRPASSPAVAPATVQPATQVPAPWTGQGVSGWFGAFMKPMWEKQLVVKFAAFLALICIGQTVALIRMAEVSGPKPYFVAYDPRSGAMAVTNQYAEEYTPNAANNRYFLVLWASRVYTISADTQDTLNVQIPAASSWTVGAATTELKTLVTVTDPVAERVVKIPGLTRKFEENSTSFSPDGQQAYMIFTTTESVAGKSQPPKQQLLTISFVDAPQTLKPDEQKTNPPGLRILHFTVTPYIGITPGAAS